MSLNELFKLLKDNYDRLPLDNNNFVYIGTNKKGGFEPTRSIDGVDVSRLATDSGDIKETRQVLGKKSNTRKASIRKRR